MGGRVGRLHTEAPSVLPSDVLLGEFADDTDKRSIFVFQPLIV